MVKTIDFKGAPCIYRVKGKGKAVMLVHGFMEEGTVWKAVSKELKSKYKVIVPDLPGFGKSQIGKKAVLSMEWYAEFLKAICAQEKLKSFILIGHSMGGYISLAFAAKYPQLIAGLGLLNSHCFEDTAEKKASRRKSIAFIRKNGTAPFVKELYAQLFAEKYKKKHKRALASMIKQALAYSPEAVIGATEAMIKRKDRSEVLRKAKVPVLLISGKEDKVVPLDLSLKQASLAPFTEIHLLPKTGHMSMLERKKETMAAIYNFIELSGK
jgi:pimeloyl-ACP methyl ester carboxylesterase